MLNPSEIMNLTDLAKFGGDGRLNAIVNEYEVNTTLLSDLPARPANNGFEDDGYFEEPWELNKTSKTTNLDRGPNLYKTGIYMRKDVMGMRDSAIGIQERKYKAQKANAVAWRTHQNYIMMRNLGLDVENDIIYGDPKKDPNQCLGLEPRFNILTDEDGVILSGPHAGEMSPYTTLSTARFAASNAAPTISNGALCSAYIIVPGTEDGVCRIYNPDSEYQLGVKWQMGEFSDMPMQDPADNTKTEIQSYAFDKFTVTNGVVINNRKACIRIANIDYGTSNGLQAFENTLYYAFECIPTELQNRARIYVPKMLVPRLKIHYKNRVNPTTYEGAMPRNITGDFSVDYYDFRKLVHLSMGESEVV